MTTHELKTWPEPFQALLDGTKTHEIRVADRPYAVGDVLELREFVPVCWGGFWRWLTSRPLVIAHYTDRSLRVEVTYLSPGGTWGLPANLCVMSIRKVEAA